MELLVEHLPTDIGEIVLITDAEDRLRALDWSDYAPRMHRLLRLHYGAALQLSDRPEPSQARHRIAAYMAGDLAAIDALPVATGGTAFQRQVWAALREIPTGSVESYAALAQRIGRDKAMRAVGMANGANPVGIVVPCHRVIGANGALTGYGGGLHRKQWLLRHEKALS